MRIAQICRRPERDPSGRPDDEWSGDDDEPASAAPQDRLDGSTVDVRRARVDATVTAALGARSTVVSGPIPVGLDAAWHARC